MKRLAMLVDLKRREGLLVRAVEGQDTIRRVVRRPGLGDVEAVDRLRGVERDSIQVRHEQLHEGGGKSAGGFRTNRRRSELIVGFVSRREDCGRGFR